MAGEGGAGPVIETARLLLRPWREEDKAPFAAMNGDPCVMRYFPSVLTRDESDAMVDTARARAAADGICFQPVIEKAGGSFIGFVGLNRPRHPLPFLPCIEIGWRLARSAWGQGYASEAAQAWLRFGFETQGLDEIVSFTAVLNAPSRRVMERIGMRRDTAADFAHPAIDGASPLSPHVLYRLGVKDWASHRGGGSGSAGDCPD